MPDNFACILPDQRPDHLVVDMRGHVVSVPQRFVDASPNMPADGPSVVTDAFNVLVDCSMEGHGGREKCLRRFNIQDLIFKE